MYGQDNKYEGLKAMALELLEWFDPEDPYWRGDDDAMSTTSQNVDDDDDGDDTQTQSSADDSLPSLEDLQQVLKTLEIKRKRILSRMLSEAPTADCVNELNTVELHISRVEAIILKLESGSATSSSGSRPVPENDTRIEDSGIQSSSLAQNSNAANNTPFITTTAAQTTKTTHKVAPMVHSQQQLGQVNPSLYQQQQKPSGDLNMPPLMSTADLQTTLLQQQMMMNQMNQLMMQQLGISAPNASFPGSGLTGQLSCTGLPSSDPSTSQMLRSFGRGVMTSTEADQLQQQQQQHQQQLQMLQSQLLQQPGSALFPGLGDSALQNSRLFSLQQAFNPQLPGMGLLSSSVPTAMPSSPSSQAPNLTSTPLPPGLGFMGLQAGRGMNSQPQVGAVSPQPSGLRPFLQPQPQQQQQQQLPNFALSAFQRHQQQ
ncbi:hypothetical protein ElyMa_000130400 [Elysia marginata]|uniref:Uncharacterized protein n=1 Tax=Elysia marginata TaxID=1093978 RepID=A0AAV4EMS3_9GAST|nr:hypothetical protein ElyMa_000130400 [Elysia marginata]